MLPDAFLAVVVLFAAGVWGAHYWHQSWAAGRQPFFYQEYFEPAVMTACGKGFVVASPPIARLTDFLLTRRDRFDCGEIPSNVTFRFATFQAPWRYLMMAVANAWRVLGISWSGLGPLAGALCGVATAISYGVFRLGMGRLFALGGAFAFAVSPIHLTEVPHVRDYAKAPFALACLLILGLMVSRTFRPRTVLALSALFGAVVGFGYGFRSDLLIYLPPFFVTLALFMPEGVTKNVGPKALAGVACLSAFVVTAWPILSIVSQSGSCLWHFVLLGLTSTFTDNLRLIAAPYDWGHKFADRWVYATIVAFAERRHPDLGIIQYCSRPYDTVGLEYFIQIVKTFPVDMATRGIASIVGIMRESLWQPPPLPGFAPTLYLWRARFLRHLPGTGLLWVVGAVLVTAGADLRLGLFLAAFVVYFAGYPAIQFHPRHDFHLELMPWWAMGFVVSQAGRRLRIWMSSDRGKPLLDWAGLRRACAFALAGSSVLAGCFFAVRAIHDRGVRRLFESYIAAPKQPIEYSPARPGSLHPIAMPEHLVYPYQFLEIDIRTAACGPEPSVTIRYEPQPDSELSRTVLLEHENDLTAVTRVFAPVYEFFQGIELSNESDGCVVGVYRFADPRPFPILVNATLCPHWQSEPLHQRIAGLW